MDTQDSQNTYKESKSIILDLETLTKKYQNLLIEYQQAVVNYIDYIKEEVTDSSSNSNNSFVTIKGSAYWGTAGITQNNSNTLNKCKASCNKTTGCTGAIFNATDYNEPKCWLRSGSSTITTGKEGDYAIINKAQYLLSVVQTINEKLTTINQKIVSQTSEGQPLYNSQLEDSISQNKILINKYNSLTKDRAKITEMMNEYQTLDQQQIQGDLTINQNYYSYLLLLTLAIIIIFILYKLTGILMINGPMINGPMLQSGDDLGKNAYYIVSGLILLTVVLYFLMKRK